MSVVQALPEVQVPLLEMRGISKSFPGVKALDHVAYIRFASVYKDFREARDFEEFAGSVSEAGEGI